MKRTFGALATVLLLAAVAYYGTLWYGARSAISKVGEAVSPWGNLHWDSARPAWDGSIIVEGLRWRWFDITRPVFAQRVTLEAPGLTALPSWLLNGNQPRRWRMTIDNAQLTVEPDLFRPWAHSRRALSLQRYPLYFHGCGEQAALTPADLLRMGLDRIAGDIELADRGSEAEEHRYRIEADAGRMGSFSLDWDADSFHVPILSGEHGVPSLPEQGRLMVRDAGLMRRLSSFCAAAEDEPVGEWVEKTSSHWAGAMADQGMVPTDATTALYGAWLRGGGELALAWALDPDKPPEDGLSSGEWQRRTGLDVTYNDEELEDIGFSLEETRPARSGTDRAPLVPVEESSPEPAFRESDTERAGAWIDRRVRVTLTSGRSVEGQLVAREGGALHIRRSLEGGTVVAPFKVANIDRFEVWRRADDMGRPIEDGDDGPALEDFLNPDLGVMPPIPKTPGAEKD